MSEMFEEATRLHLRFLTASGSLSVEDLWDLPLKRPSHTDLNTVARTLDQQLKRDTVSFVDDDDKIDPRQQLAFEIVKHVIAVKKAEQKAALEARDKAAMKQKLRAVLARKQDEKLESMSAEDIEAAIAAL